jgi:hypothetical protein
MTDTVVEAKLAEERIAGSAERASLRSRSAWITRFDAYDFATIVLVTGLVVIALCTFKDYAISNDEGVQHHCGLGAWRLLPQALGSRPFCSDEAHHAAILRTHE